MSLPRHFYFTYISKEIAGWKRKRKLHGHVDVPTRPKEQRRRGIHTITKEAKLICIKVTGLTLERIGVTQRLDLRLRLEGGGPILEVQCGKRARGKEKCLKQALIAHGYR